MDERPFLGGAQRPGIQGCRGIIAAVVDAADQQVGEAVRVEVADPELHAAGGASVEIIPDHARLLPDFLDRDRTVAHRDAHRGAGLDIFGRDDRDLTVAFQDLNQDLDALGAISVIVCYEYLHSWMRIYTKIWNYPFFLI